MIDCGARAAVLLAVISSAALGLTSCSKTAAEREGSGAASEKPVAARVVTVEVKEIRRNVESVGSLFPYEEVTVSSEVEGKVEQVLVDVGDSVVKGQAIVKVAPLELQLSLEQQKAAMQQARARLGLPDGGEDIEDVNQAAEVKKAAADLNDVEQKYRRAKALFDEGLLPRQDLDEAEARYKSARATHDLAVQQVENLRAQLAQYRASVALAQKKLTDSVITAPFGGQIKDRTVAPGQYLRVQTPVVVIVNADPLRVRLGVPEKMAGWVKVGHPVTITVEAYPDRTFTGRLWRISPAVDQQNRSFEAEALIDNHERLLKPGFFVKARIPSDQVERALVVPEEALLYAYGVYKVFTVEGDVTHEAEVRLGDRSNGEVEIIEGLKEGGRVAIPVKGQELKEGARIEVVQ